jgi:hypothetical protein
MRMIPLLIALMMAPQAPSASAQLSQTPAQRSLVRLDLYEAVIRYQIKSWEQKAHTYCIAVNGVDAEWSLLDRLRPFQVKRASACHRLNQKPVMPVVDARQKESVIFNLGIIRSLSDAEVEIEGGYFCGNLCVAQGIYHVVHAASGWQVSEFEAHLTL